MITMLLGGLWHGASMNFLVWGGLHGLALCIHQMLGGETKQGALPRLSFSDVPKIVTTYAAVSLITVFFLPETLSGAFTYLSGLFSFRGGPFDMNGGLLFAICAGFVLVIDIAQRTSGKHDVVLQWPAVVRGASYATIVLWLLIWMGGKAQEFIYFQF